MIQDPSDGYGTSKRPTSKEVADYLIKIYSEKYHGFYQGFVEYNHDPFCLGRVIVRVMNVFKTPKAIPTDRLPWAIRCELGGGGYDYGGFVPLQVGAAVWVTFRNGDARYPIVVGTLNATPRDRQTYGQWRSEFMPIAQKHTSMGVWAGRSSGVDKVVEEGEEPSKFGQTEIPAEARQAAFNEPTVSVFFKSWKGASLVVEDRHGKERMDLLDRSGQGLSFESRIKPGLNTYNAAQRGLRSVFRGDQYDYRTATDNRGSSVSLRDLAQQGILLEAKDKDERVRLVSKAPNPSDSSYGDFDQGANVQVLELGAGRQKTILLGMKNGRTMFKLSFDSQNGVVDIESQQSLRLKSRKIDMIADSITFEGDTIINGNLTVSGETISLGDLTTGSLKRDKPRNYR